MTQPKQPKGSGNDDDGSRKKSEEGSSSTPQAPEPEAVSELGATKTQTESLNGTLARFTGAGQGQVVWASPFDMYQSGSFKGLSGYTVDQMAKDIKGIVFTAVFHAYLLIGYYLSAVFFGNDESKVFSKNPYKDTSLSDLARRRDIPLSRQKMGDCIKAASVDLELRKGGHHLDSLAFTHLLEVSRLKNREQRIQVAQDADARRLTAAELKKEINVILGKGASEDKRIGKTVTKQLGELVKMSRDEETRQFLLDKDRLKAALSTKETAHLLEQSEKFRETVEESQQLLRQLENTLIEIMVEKRKVDKPESAEEPSESSD
jgi:hypothetical protein